MKSILLVFSLLFVPLVSQALTQPSIQKRPRKVGAVQLGPDVEAALKAFDPNFRIFKDTEFILAVQDIFAEEAEDGETPMAVVADFNGDRIRDVAVIGTNGKDQLTLGILSGPEGYSIQVIQREPYLAPDKSFHPPMIDSDYVSDEAEGERWRQQGLITYLAVVKSIAKTPPEKRSDGVKRFRNDALMIDTFLAASTRLIYVKDGNFREWKPRR